MPHIKICETHESSPQRDSTALNADIRKDKKYDANQ